MVSTLVTACSALPSGRALRLRSGAAGSSALACEEGARMLMEVCFG